MIKATVNTLDFKEGLDRLMKLKELKGTKYGDVKLAVKSNDTVMLTRTNLSQYAVIELNGCTFGNGEVVLSNVKKLISSFKSFKETDTSIEINSQEAILTNGDKVIKYKNTIKAEDFPELPIINIKNTYKYNTKDLHDRLKKVNHSKSKDNTRPTLTGVYFNNSDMAALDGYRLTLDEDRGLSVGEEFIIPGELSDYLLRVLDKKPKDLEIQITEDELVVFKWDNINIISSLISGIFFEYRKIIADSFKEKVGIDKKMIKEALDFLQPMIKGMEMPSVVIEGNDKGLILKATDEDVNTYEVQVECEPPVYDDMRIAFNINYLMDIVKFSTSDKLVLNYNGSLNPMVVDDTEDTNTRFLVLPIRLAA